MAKVKDDPNDLSDDILLPGETLPTPEEIAQRCDEIQAGWSDSVRANRRVYKPQPLTVTRSGLPHDVAVPLAGDYDD